MELQIAEEYGGQYDKDCECERVSDGGGGALPSRQKRQSSLEECEAVLYNPEEGVSGGRESEEASWIGRLGLAVSELLLCQGQISGSGCLLIR